MILINMFDIFTQIPSIIELDIDNPPRGFIPIDVAGIIVYIDEEAYNQDALDQFNYMISGYMANVSHGEIALLYVLYDEYLQVYDQIYDVSQFKRHLDIITYISPMMKILLIDSKFPYEFTDSLTSKNRVEVGTISPEYIVD